MSVNAVFFSAIVAITVTTVSYGKETSVEASCAAKYASLIGPLIEDKVSILYFPKAIHTKLHVDGKVYDGTLGYSLEKHSIEAFRRRARTGGKGIYEISLRVTESELSAIKNFLETNLDKSAFQSCVSGACRPLRSQTAMRIPIPFNMYPSWNVGYMKLAKALGYNRVTKVEYVGNQPLSDAGQSILLNSWFEFVGGTGLAAIPAAPLIIIGNLIVTYIDERGKSHEEVVNVRSTTAP